MFAPNEPPSSYQKETIMEKRGAIASTSGRIMPLPAGHTTVHRSGRLTSWARSFLPGDKQKVSFSLSALT
jgi:hypothetical protein